MTFSIKFYFLLIGFRIPFSFIKPFAVFVLLIHSRVINLKKRHLVETLAIGIIPSTEYRITSLYLSFKTYYILLISTLTLND